MQLKESIRIEASPDAVWQYVGQPDCWPLFHAKVRRAKQLSLQAGVAGSVYEIEFMLGAKSSPTRCEIVDLVPERMIEVKSVLPIPQGGPERFARLTYELEDEGRQTKVTERIDMSGVGMGRLLGAVVWFISRFGRPSGQTTLMRLKKVVES
jgi:uncharacterized protein YndB with AHSA1/START domain